ncbi:MAG: polynucleotide adenylyltransferase PcnB [Planctomycetes bacterium]|nr:polynucleotide adenylyltransferase PcnB [Planctomycetota bacterium]
MPKSNDRRQAGASPTRSSPRTITADSIPPEMLDPDALRVIARLEREGHQAYLVGGCVRDLLIGRTPKDFDVASDAHPRQIKRLFRNGRIIGRRFKLVHIQYGDHIIETATFRRDPEPRESENDTGDAVEDAKRDLDDLLITEDNVFGNAEEDARRRDFTVNALFLDPTKRTVIDYVGGLEDLEHGVLRTIGDPHTRLAEDPVRILRAVKFATRLGFRIDDDTWNAMIAIAPRLSRSAPPRVLEEILRLMRSGTALGAFRMLRACGALAVILPAIDRYLGAKDDSQAQTRAGSFWRLLEALDSDVHQGYLPSTSVCIALLYLRIIEREADPATREMKGKAPDLVTVTAEVLVPVGLATRLPRRETMRARKIILLQRRFVQTSTKRFRPLAFLRSEDFPDSLALFRLRMAARGQGWDIYEGWKERHRLALSAPKSELEAEGSGKRRRRRRKPRTGGDASAGGKPAPTAG